MSGAAPILGRPVALAVLGLLLWVPSVSAAPMEIDISYDGAPTLEGEGTWLATDGFVDLHAGEIVPSYQLQIQAEKVTVKTQTWDYQKTHILVWGDERRSAREETTTVYTDATIVLDSLRSGARIALSSDSWSLSASFSHASLHSVQDVWASADPDDTEHIEEYDVGGETEGRLWSHTVHLEDQVLAEAATVDFDAAGHGAMTLYEGDLKIQTSDGTAHHTSGETDQISHPLLGDDRKASRRQLIIATFEGAEFSGHWGGYSRVASAAPTILLAGAFDTASARGTVAMDRMALRAHDDPVRAEGSMTLTPRVDPTRETLPFDPYTEEVVYYHGGDLAAKGDATKVVLAASQVKNPFSDGSDLIVATGTGLGLLGIAYSLWRYGPLAFAALYSRLEESDLLENPTRAELYQIVCANPGISVRAVARRVKCSRSTVIYHLKRLEIAGYLRKGHAGDAVIFVERTGLAASPDIYRVLQSNTTLCIAKALLTTPSHTQGQIARSADKSRSTVSYHLLKLERHGLVEVRSERMTKSYQATNLLKRVVGPALGLDEDEPIVFRRHLSHRRAYTDADRPWVQ